MRSPEPKARAGRRRFGRLTLISAATLAVPALRAAPAAPGETVRWPAVRLLDGSRRSAADWQGRAAVVVFFSTTCPYCRRHLPRIDRLARSGSGLEILLAAEDRDADTVRQHLAAMGSALPVTLDQAPLHEALSLRRVVPLSCVVDRQGRLREVIPGEMAEDDVLELARWATR